MPINQVPWLHNKNFMRKWPKIGILTYFENMAFEAMTSINMNVPRYAFKTKVFEKFTKINAFRIIDQNLQRISFFLFLVIKSWIKKLKKNWNSNFMDFLSYYWAHTSQISERSDANWGSLFDLKRSWRKPGTQLGIQYALMTMYIIFILIYCNISSVEKLLRTCTDHTEMCRPKHILN